MMPPPNADVETAKGQVALTDQPTQDEQDFETVDLGAGVTLSAKTLGPYSGGDSKIVARIVSPDRRVIKERTELSRAGYEKYKGFIKRVARRAASEPAMSG